MKLRIKGDSIRLRLSQDEIRSLRRGDRVSIESHISPTQSFTYQLLSASVDRIEVSLANNVLEVRVPKENLDQWTSSDQVGITSVLQNDQKDGLQVLIEKDFKCLIPRPSEDEANLFPNPMAEKA